MKTKLSEKMQTRFDKAFEGAFMQPEIYYHGYYEVYTTSGHEIIPADVANVPEFHGVIDEDDGDIFWDVAVALHEYTQGEIRTVERKKGWLARTSAPGYMDATEWSGFDDLEEAAEYLIEYYGNEPEYEIFEYFINLDERGEFYADVRNEQGKTVFEFKGYDIFEDGFMGHKHDLDGLKEYLVGLGLMKKEDELIRGD